MTEFDLDNQFGVAFREGGRNVGSGGAEMEWLGRTVSEVSLGVEVGAAELQLGVTEDEYREETGS